MRLTKIIQDGMIVLKRMQAPLYSRKFSKKTYTIHQHLLYLSIKEIQQQSFRDCRDFFDEFNQLQEALRLPKVPHFTTPQKCLQRFPPRWYKMLLKQLICLIKSRANAVIDGTGLLQKKVSFSSVKGLRSGRKTIGITYDHQSINFGIAAFLGRTSNKEKSDFFEELKKKLLGYIISG